MISSKSIHFKGFSVSFLATRRCIHRRILAALSSRIYIERIGSSGRAMDISSTDSRFQKSNENRKDKIEYVCTFTYAYMQKTGRIHTQRETAEQSLFVRFNTGPSKNANPRVWGERTCWLKSGPFTMELHYHQDDLCSSSWSPKPETLKSLSTCLSVLVAVAVFQGKRVAP